MISFLDLKLINTPFFDKLEEASTRTIRNGWYLLGNELKNFEEAFARYCDAKYCVGVANGLDAITLILKSFELPAKSEIIVPANTYIATVLPVSALGYTPVLVEPDPATMLLDPDLIEQHITVRTKAIITTDLYGRSCAIDRVLAIADQYGLKVVTDAAQAHGATYQGRKVGSWAHATAFSFYPTKNLGALGDAGAVVTSDAELADKIRFLRNYGSLVRYQNEYKGVNSRMDELQAAFLNIKLPYLDRDNQRRKTIARKYLQEIKLPQLILPATDQIDEDVWHLFVVKHPQRDRLKAYLFENGIQADIHYPTPIHKQKAYKQFNHLPLPITEKLCQEVLSLPLHPMLTDDEIDYIVETVNKFNSTYL